MDKRDARTISQDAQFEIRRQAVKLYQKGMSYVDISKQLEVNRNSVSEWIRTYQRDGLSAIRPRKRGPVPGSTMQLNEAQQKSTRAKLIDSDPEQNKLPFALWTREAVGLLIEQETGLKLDLRQVGRYLRRWGFTPQRPVKQAYQRCAKKVKTWLEDEYPAIERKAREEGAEIHWADETGLNSHDHRGRGFAPKGKTPVRKHNAQYEKINMISSVTNKGKLRFICYKGSFNYQMFHKFLKKLVIEAGGRKLIVIVDNLRVHHAKVIKRWLRWHKKYIEVFYLPSYSPDLNPDEYLNCDLKTELAKRPERRTKGRWAETVQDVASDLANKPERVASYFDAKSIKYAK